MIRYNNHKLVRTNTDLIHKTVIDSITKRFAITFPIGTEKLLPDAMICLVGIIEQKSFTSKGMLETKQ
jgi:hypothetical protein